MRGGSPGGFEDTGDVGGKAEDREGSGEAVAQRQEPQSALPSPKPPAGSPLFVQPFPCVSLPLLLGTHRRRERGGQSWRESGREEMGGGVREEECKW